MIPPNVPDKAEVTTTAVLTFDSEVGTTVEVGAEVEKDEAVVETGTEVDVDDVDVDVLGNGADEDADEDVDDADGGVYPILTSYLKQKIMNVYFMLIIKKVFLK